MSGTLNKVMLIGHLGTNERVTNTEWHNVVVRNKAAEICEKYLTKGDKVYIEGRLKTRKWQDDKGQDRYSTEVQCNEFTFLSTKKDNLTNQQTGNQAQPVQQKQDVVEEASGNEDDLPF